MRGIFALILIFYISCFSDVLQSLYDKHGFDGFLKGVELTDDNLKLDVEFLKTERDSITFDSMLTTDGYTMLVTSSPYV